jgi:glycolate oxidase
MINKTIIKHLQKIVGKKYVTTAPEDLLSYSYDATQIMHLPEVVVFPGTAEEVAAIVKLANQYRFAIVPRGAGSGMSGGAVPVKGGIVLAMSRLNRILEIDCENMTVWVEPGVVTAELQEAVAKKGLFYPPDPASLNFSSIGGNVAECAGGARAVKYGVTKDYVLGLEVVLPNGEIIHTGKKTIKRVTGYDLTSLFVGSEGTLGIFTKVLLRLLPLPETRAAILLGIPKLSSLPLVLKALLNLPEPLTAIEFIDDLCLKCIISKLPFKIPPVEGLLLLEIDGSKKIVKIRQKWLIEILKQLEMNVITTALDEEVKTLWEVRRAISPAVFQLGEKKSSHDIVVPRAKLLPMIERIKSLRNEYNLPVLCFGHIGDGNLHVNIMYNQDEEEKAKTITEEVIKTVLALDGTISGEHGIGLTKARFMPWEIEPAALKLMQALKHTLDPNNILNPGKIFGESENVTFSPA